MVWVNDDCICCSACVAHAPEHFDLDDEGRAEVVAQPTTHPQWVLCQQAADLCPVEAIRLAKPEPLTQPVTERA
ncbi:MAG: ferredoxin [Myxococcales bacterium]|nr:ferredoxin [Myxococcales bacterium]